MIMRFENWELAIAKYYEYVVNYAPHGLIVINNIDELLKDALMLTGETEKEIWIDEEACK